MTHKSIFNPLDLIKKKYNPTHILILVIAIPIIVQLNILLQMSTSLPKWEYWDFLDNLARFTSNNNWQEFLFSSYWGHIVPVGTIIWSATTYFFHFDARIDSVLGWLFQLMTMGVFLYWQKDLPWKFLLGLLSSSMLFSTILSELFYNGFNNAIFLAIFMASLAIASAVNNNSLKALFAGTICLLMANFSWGGGFAVAPAFFIS